MTPYAARINHVSFPVHDIEECVAFYEQVLGAQRVPIPNFRGRADNFGGPATGWVRLGASQVHFFQKADHAPPSHYHFGVTVDNVEPIYREAQARNCLDTVMGNPIQLLPGDSVQVFLRDPAGYLVEVDSFGWDRLPPDMRASARELAGPPEKPEHEGARLFL